MEIVDRGVNGEDAAENLRRLEFDVIDAKPDLVIWPRRSARCSARCSA